MREMAVSDFKAHALSVLKAVAETGESVVVTKRGTPLARVAPYSAPKRAPEAGRLAGTVEETGDVVAPVASGQEGGAG